MRFISSTVSLNGNFKWEGKIYCRHGGCNHKSWWVLSRQKKIFLQTTSGFVDDLEYNDLDICVYVMKSNSDMNKLKNEFMTYIGGQSKIQCEKNHLPFIVSKDNTGRFYQTVDGRDDVCGRKYQ